MEGREEVARDMSVPGWTWWALEPTNGSNTMNTALNPSAPRLLLCRAGAYSGHVRQAC